MEAKKRKQPSGKGRLPGVITAKQELFVREYLIDFNATQAAIRAGYSKKTAGAIGHEALKNPKIQEEIDRAQHQALLRADLSLDKLINELKHMGLWSIKDFIGDGNTILDLSALPREILKPVVGIKTTERYDEEGNPVKTVELKMVDKRAAVIDLIRYLGGFEKDNDQKAVKIVVKRR